MSRETELMREYAARAKAAGVPEDQFANFAKASAVFTPKQLEASAAARCADSPSGPVEIGYGGARGGGKSHWLLGQMGLDDCQRHPALKCLLLRKVGKSNMENLHDLRMRLFMRTPHTFSTRGIVTFANGSKIIAGHFQNEKDIDTYLGLEYDVIGIEEATTLTSRKYQDIQTCCRTSKRGWRPRIYNTTNPGGVGHAWYRAKFIQNWRAKSESVTRFVPSLVTDNPWNNPDYVRVLDSLTGWKKRAWRDGDWDIAAGQYFTTFRLEVHRIAQLDEKKIVEWFAGFDYGFTHYTVFLLGGRDSDGNVYIVDEHAERNWLPDRHADAIHAMLTRHGLNVRSLDRISCGTDLFAKESDGETIAKQYKELGITMTGANMDRVNGWSEILKLLGDVDAKPAVVPRLRIHARCARLLETVPLLQHDPNRPEDVDKVDTDDDGIGGDDAADALRYMVATKTHKITMQKVKGI